MSLATRCLSIRQPFAWAVVANIKKIENRSWGTTYRGTIAIHASAARSDTNTYRKTTGCEFFTEGHLSFGAIIGLADIVDVALYGPEHEQDSFAFGPHCWKLANGRLLEKPIPLKGKLNLFKLDLDVVEQLASAKTLSQEFDSTSLSMQAAHAMTEHCDPYERYRDLCYSLMDDIEYRNNIQIWAERMLDLDSSQTHADAILGYISLIEENHESALNYAERAHQLDPSYVVPCLTAARAAMQLGRLAEATAYSDKIIALVPEDPMGILIQAELRYRSKDYQGTIKSCLNLLNLDSDAVDAYDLMAKAFLAKGQRTEAKKVIQQALIRWPDDKILLDLLKSTSNQKTQQNELYP